MRALFFTLLLTLPLMADVPSWLSELSATTLPVYPAKTKAVSLFNEERVVVEPSGKRTTTIRKAFKVLTSEGKEEAVAVLDYDTKGSKVRDLKGWLIAPSGKVREYSRKDAIEGSSKASYSLYSSTKYTMLSVKSDIDTGGVFGFEATLEEDSVFSQFIWNFQDDLPHLLSRFQLTVPAGWKAEAKAYSGANAQPIVSGNTYTWEARSLPPMEWEAGSPRFISILPRVAVSMIPPDGTPMIGGPLACFRTWKDVSDWESGLIEPQSQVTAAIQSKVAELTAGKSDLMAKIEALAEYAQKIRYVSISINTQRGGGYVPNKADEVLLAAYGDCKDKSNLLRTMLKVIQVESYPVGIYSGDPRFTLDDFPSPHQFNHAIIAIRVPETVDLPAVATYPDFGRILFFDPTDTHVPFGYLPEHEQNSNVLLTTAGKGALVKTPKVSEKLNHLQRTWSLAIDAEGTVAGTMTEVSTGQAAFREREMHEGLTPDRYRKMMDAFLARSMAGSEITELTLNYDNAKKEFRTVMQFRAPAYARIMQGRLWMLRSVPVQLGSLPNTNPKERERPLVVRSVNFDEDVTWTLPAGLKLDELPDPGIAMLGKNKQLSVWKQNGDVVSLKRHLEFESDVIQPDGYKKFRDFISRFHGAGEAPIVLLKQ